MLQNSRFSDDDNYIVMTVVSETFPSPGLREVIDISLMVQKVKLEQDMKFIVNKV